MPRFLQAIRRSNCLNTRNNDDPDDISDGKEVNCLDSVRRRPGIPGKEFFQAEMRTNTALIIALATVTACFVVSTATAQDCTQSALALKPGSFKASKLAGSTSGIMSANLVREKAALANVHKMIASSYTPTGVVAFYSTYFDGGNPQPGSVKIADSFGYTMYLLRYNCDKNSADKSKFYFGTDSPTVLRINANAVNTFRLSATDISDNTSRGYLLMKNRPQKIKGFYFLGDEFSGEPRTKQRSYTWLITYDDSLPFSYVSRREYLLLSKARLQKTIREDENNSEFYTEFADRIEQYLKKPDAELNLPAIVSAGDEERFTGFREEGSRGAYFCVKHNPSYYKKGLSQSSAQFFTVVFDVWEGDDVPVYVDNMNAIKKALDFDVLRSILGK